MKRSARKLRRQARNERRRLAVLKYRELFLYLAAQGQVWGRNRREAMLRAELLAYMSDLTAYAELGHSITGGRWIKGKTHPEWRIPK